MEGASAPFFMHCYDVALWYFVNLFKETVPFRAKISMIELTREIHFWQSWWFWVLTCIILFFATFIFIRSRIERSRRNQVRLEVKIAERTRKFVYKKRKSKSKIDSLKKKRTKYFSSKRSFKQKKTGQSNG